MPTVISSPQPMKAKSQTGLVAALRYKGAYGKKVNQGLIMTLKESQSTRLQDRHDQQKTLQNDYLAVSPFTKHLLVTMRKENNKTHEDIPTTSKKGN